MIYSPYGSEEVSVLIHSYLELRVCTSQFVRTRLMDISRCWKMMNWNERHALFLMGVCHLPSREAGALMGISHTHTLSHYNTGKDNLLNLMNGVGYHNEST